MQLFFVFMCVLAIHASPRGLEVSVWYIQAQSKLTRPGEDQRGA